MSVVRGVVRGTVRGVTRTAVGVGGGDLTLPSLNRLAYLTAPNTGGGTTYTLDVSIYPAVGAGLFFANSTTPIAVTATTIAADPSVNKYHILFYNGKLVIYDPDAPYQTIQRAFGFMGIIFPNDLFLFQDGYSFLFQDGSEFNFN